MSESYLVAIAKLMLSIKMKWIAGSVFIGVLMMPDLMLELLHSIFELVEFTLDSLVEHLFHTDRHTSQVIVFYLLLSLLAVTAYQTIRRFRLWYAQSKAYFLNTGRRIDMVWRDYWLHSAFLEKAKLCAGLTAGFGVLTLLLFT